MAEIIIKDVAGNLHDWSLRHRADDTSQPGRVVVSDSCGSYVVSVEAAEEAFALEPRTKVTPRQDRDPRRPLKVSPHNRRRIMGPDGRCGASTFEGPKTPWDAARMSDAEFDSFEERYWHRGT
jgi:hypothetical protein